MIPIRDSIRSWRLASVNTALIAANFIIFAYEARLAGAADLFLYRYGMIPARLAGLAASPSLVNALAPLTMLTSLFLHGGFFHVAGNMLYLFIFGSAVEERFGHGRYLAFYLLSGVAAAIATIWMDPASAAPVVGASGAIAGVLGAYFVLFPRARILTILPLIIFIQFVEVPAVLYLTLWFAVQLFEGLYANAGHGPPGGVAWWSHVGGFLFGVATAPLIARQPIRRRAVKTLW
jgi:membrane associated rhomboid family serine protease